jgi:ERF superfamily
VIVAAVKPYFQRHGLSYRIDTRVEPGTPAFLVATCTVHHREGHSESSEFRVPVNTSGRMNPAQEYGSAGTYSKRYAFCNAFGILTGDEDDDGQSLGSRDEASQPAPSPGSGSTDIMDPAQGVVHTARITPAQHRLLEVRIGQLGLDRERVKDWLKRASKGRIEYLNDLPAELFDRLLAKLDEWGTPVKYRPCLGGEDQPVGEVVQAFFTSFEEVLRLAHLARVEEDREVVLDLARELPPEQRVEVERVLAGLEEDYLDEVREGYM